MKIDLSINDWNFILDVLNSMQMTTEIAIGSVLKKQDWEKWSRFTKYSAKCAVLENKIKEILENGSEL